MTWLQSHFCGTKELHFQGAKKRPFRLSYLPNSHRVYPLESAFPALHLTPWHLPTLDNSYRKIKLYLARTCFSSITSDCIPFSFDSCYNAAPLFSPLSIHLTSPHSSFLPPPPPSGSLPHHPSPPTSPPACSFIPHLPLPSRPLRLPPIIHRHICPNIKKKEPIPISTQMTIYLLQQKKPSILVR